MAPVGRHLPAAGAGIVFRADGLEQGFERCDAEHQAERAVAIVRVNPVNAGTKKQAGCGSDRFVAGAGDLEINFILAF